MLTFFLRLCLGRTRLINVSFGRRRRRRPPSLSLSLPPKASYLLFIIPTSARR